VGTVSKGRALTVLHGLAIDRAVNIGPVLSARLRSVGVETLEQLKRQGALEVWQLIAAQTPPEECVHTLLALEGAIRATRWTAIDQGERDRLVAAAGLDAQ
jgi:DNA transformation protein and related proteins